MDIELEEGALLDDNVALEILALLDDKTNEEELDGRGVTEFDERVGKELDDEGFSVKLLEMLIQMLDDAFTG